jgi:hypothetical protein
VTGRCGTYVKYGLEQRDCSLFIEEHRNSVMVAVRYYHFGGSPPVGSLGGNVPDPIVAATVAKAALHSAEGSAKQALPGLMSRVLGPSADELGEVFRLWTAYRLRNVRRMIAAAERKADGGEDDSVHPRVAHQVLDSGSYCDDELMAEYYGGLLAAARTPNGRDDRAISWSTVVTGMSSIQIRAHYLLYREWAARLHGMDLNLGVDRDRIRTRMDIDMTEFIPLLDNGNDLDVNALIGDSIVGLVRLGLLHDRYSFGPRDIDNAPESPYETLLRVEAAPSGLQLYGWAQGLPGVYPGEFTKKAIAFETDPPIPRMVGVSLMLVDAKGADSNSPGLSNP